MSDFSFHLSNLSATSSSFSFILNHCFLSISFSLSSFLFFLLSTFPSFCLHFPFFSISTFPCLSVLPYILFFCCQFFFLLQSLVYVYTFPFPFPVCFSAILFHPPVFIIRHIIFTSAFHHILSPDCLHSFVHQIVFTHLFTRLPSPICSPDCLHSFVHSFVHQIVFTHLFTRLSTHVFTRLSSLICSPDCLRSFVHQIVHSLVHQIVFTHLYSFILNIHGFFQPNSYNNNYMYLGNLQQYKQTDVSWSVCHLC